MDIVGANAVKGNGKKNVPITPRKGGRPKGSRNKVTLLKLIAEEAVRTNNAQKIMEVCDLVVEQALQGDKSSQKLVWQSVVSNGITEEKNATEKVEIKIGTISSPMKEVNVPPKEVIINPKEIQALDSKEIEDVSDS